MAHGRSRTIIPQEYRNTTWPTPSEASLEQLNKQDADLYELRRRAVEAFRAGSTYAKIRGLHGISRSELNRQLHRCLKKAADGHIYGYRALVPWLRIEDYTREAPLTPESGSAGAWHLLMREFKEIDNFIRKTLYAKPERKGGKPLDFRELWKTVRLLLEFEGLTKDDYPFRCKKKGEDALRNYVRELELEDVDLTIRARHGSQASYRWEHIGRGLHRTFAPFRPGSFVTLDYYMCDARTKVVFTNRVGELLEIVVPRWYVGALVEESTGAILAVCATLEKTPSTDSALEAMDCMLHPERYIQADLHGVELLDPNVFIQQIVPLHANISMVVLRVDNAWANAADSFIRAVVYTFGATVNFGPTYSWAARAIGERVIKQLAENGAQMVPSSTGSSAESDLHSDAADLAIEYNVHIGVLMHKIFEAAQEENLRRKEGLEGSSSRTAFINAHQVSHSTLVGIPLPRETIEHCRLLEREVYCEIKGDLSRGEVPYIQIDRRHFTSESLIARPDLIGETIRAWQSRFDEDVVHAETLDSAIHFGQLVLSKGRARHASLRHATLLNRAAAAAKLEEFPITQRMREFIEQYSGQKSSNTKFSSKDALVAGKQRLREQRHPKPACPPPNPSTSAAAVPRRALLIDARQTPETDRFGLFSLKSKGRTL